MKKNIFLFICLVVCLGFFCSCSKKLYTVNIIFENGTNEVIENIKKGDTITKPNHYLPEGVNNIIYQDESNNEFDFNTPINSDLTIYGIYVFNEYTVNFYDYDKTLIETYTIKHGSSLIYPANPTREGGVGYKYVFKDWSINEEIVTKDLNITARYTKVFDEMTITALDVDGSVYEVVKCDYNSYINELFEPEFEKDESKYYRFYGWYDQETDEPFDFDQEILKDYTIYPKYDIYDYEEVTLENATISFVGDSISTFYSTSSSVNSMYGGTNQFYYPIYSATVKDVSQTWWYQTYTGLNLKLGVNNSWSGSAAYGSGNSAGMSDNRLKTLGDNGTPNIVVIYLGTNDNVNGHETKQLKEAYVKMIEYITENYVDFSNNTAKIPYIYLVTNGYAAYSSYNYTEARRLEYNQMFKDLANEYSNVRIFDLATYITKDNYQTYLGDALHYNADGMKLISTKLIEKLKNDFNDTTRNIKSKQRNYKIVYYLDKKEEDN